MLAHMCLRGVSVFCMLQSVAAGCDEGSPAVALGGPCQVEAMALGYMMFPAFTIIDVILNV